MSGCRITGLDDEDLLLEIRSRLKPDEFEEWFVSALAEIRQPILAAARIDGIDQAVKDIKQLYLAWLVQQN